MGQQGAIPSIPSNYLEYLHEASLEAGTVRYAQQLGDQVMANGLTSVENNIWNSWTYHISKSNLQFSVKGDSYQPWMSVGKLKREEEQEKGLAHAAYSAALLAYLSHQGTNVSRICLEILNSAAARLSKISQIVGSDSSAQAKMGLSKLVEAGSGYTSCIDPSYVNYDAKESRVTLQELTNHVASLANNKASSGTMQGAQALLREAQTEQQEATNCANSGVTAQQNAVEQDSNMANGDVTLANVANSALQQAVSWSIPA